MKRWFLTWTFGLLACIAGVACADSVRKTAEGSMLVTGSVEVNPDGSLRGYVLDQPEKLPSVVVDVIGKSIPHWEFKLSSPTKDVVKSKMSLRVVATPAGDGNYRVAVKGASFGGNEPNEASVTYKDRSRAPVYPKMAIDARVTGTVYLLIRVGRDGTVEDAVAEQVNLEQYATPTEMDKFRKALANASLDAARHWTYKVPTTGLAVNDPYWVVRVPVNFYLSTFPGPPKARTYGSWEAYIPGPRQTAPWINKTLANQSPDTVPDGALATGQSTLQLNTPLGGA